MMPRLCPQAPRPKPGRSGLTAILAAAALLAAGCGPDLDPERLCRSAELRATAGAAPCVAACMQDDLGRDAIRQMDPACLARSLPGCSDPADGLCGCLLLEADGFDCSCGASIFEPPSISLQGSGPPTLSGVASLGVWPLKETADGWVRACEGGAQTLGIDLVLATGAANDGLRDALHPGEWFDAGGGCPLVAEPGVTLSAEDFRFGVSCAHHDDDPDAAECDAPVAGTLPVAEVDYLSLGADARPQGQEHGVVLLLDESGSVSGLVDDVSCREGMYFQDAELTPASCASDRERSRYDVARRILDALPREVPAIVFQFAEHGTGEDGLRLICDLPEPLDYQHDAERREHCWSKDRGLALAHDVQDAYVDLAQQGGGGRSNLWQAVDSARRWLGEVPGRTGHVIVLTDGPDTCSPTSDEFTHCLPADSGPLLQPPCAGGENTNTTWEQTRRAFDEAPGDVQVSFVHYPSVAHPEPDPRMAEMACLTGGQYLRTEPLDGELDGLEAVIPSLLGHWQLRLDPEAAGDLMGALPAGHAWTLEGWLSYASSVPSREPVALEVVGAFGVVAKRCRTNAQCGAGASSCGVRCDLDSGLCRMRSDGAGCSGGGVCCEGRCDESGRGFCEQSCRLPTSG